MELWKMQKANVYTFFITCFPSLSPPGKEKVFVKNSCANNTNLKTDNTDARVPERQKLEQSKVITTFFLCLWETGEEKKFVITWALCVLKQLRQEFVAGACCVFWCCKLNPGMPLTRCRTVPVPLNVRLGGPPPPLRILQV